MTSNIFLDTVNLVARAATSGTALPNVRGKLFAELVLNVRFFDGTGTIIPVDVASVLMEIKLQGAPDGSPALLQSSAPVVTGSGATTLYAFAFDYADGDGLEAALSGLTAPAAMICAIQYALSGSTEQIDVAMSFENSYIRPEDQASDPVDAERWAWLTAHATDAGGFAHDDTTRLLSVPGVATNAAAIAAEAATRGAADTTLQANINAEATARANSDTTLQGHIDGKANTSHTHDASAIVSGTLDPARIPVLYDGIHITSSGALSALTSDQQNAITNGAIVTTTDGKRWCYTGSGSKTLQASYILLADLAPDWSTISGKPSTFPPSALPAPTTTVLGGVKRNTGNSGQFVSGIGSDGALLFATPAGGGGGGTIVRAAVTLQGTTSSDTPSTAPGPLYISINDYANTLLTVAYIVSGETGFNRVFTIGYTDPADGTTFIDISGAGGPVSLAAQLASYLYYDCANAGNISFSYDGAQILTLTTNYAGSNSSITATCDNPYVCSISGGGSGTDDIPASGQISTARLLGNVSGKIIRLISVWAASSGLGQFVTLVDDYDNANIVPPIPDTGGALVVQQPDNVTIDKFFGACRGNIKASFGSGVTGGSASIYIIAEIVAVPDSGTFLYYTCLGLSYVAVIADGSGGTYTTTIESNSTNCGYGLIN